MIVVTNTTRIELTLRGIENSTALWVSFQIPPMSRRTFEDLYTFYPKVGLIIGGVVSTPNKQDFASFESVILTLPDTFDPNTEIHTLDGYILEVSATGNIPTVNGLKLTVRASPQPVTYNPSTLVASGLIAQYLNDHRPVNGKSAYDIAVENGFVGTETDWYNAQSANISAGPGLQRVGNEIRVAMTTLPLLI